MSKTNENLIAKKYATALAQIRLDESLLKELEGIKEIFLNDQELQNFLNNPKQSASDKVALLKKVFENQVSSEALKLILLATERNRFSMIPYVFDAYQELFFKSKNILLAEVISATAIDASELEKIKTKLESNFQKQIDFETKIDESLIAGFKVRVDGKIIDTSIKTKLKNIEALV